MKKKTDRKKDCRKNPRNSLGGSTKEQKKLNSTACILKTHTHVNKKNVLAEKERERRML